LVVSTNKAANSFTGTSAAVAGGAERRYVWDSDDIVLPSAANFVANLSAGDTVAVGPYFNTAAPGQSTFNLTNNIVTPIDVDVPAAPVTVDANTYTISGTGNPGYQVVAYRDLGPTPFGTYVETRDPAVSTAVTIDQDGDWSVTVPLTQGTTASPEVNRFLVVQRVAGSSLTAAASGGNVAQVPAITEQPGTGFTVTIATTEAGVVGTLAPSDVLTLTFSEAVTVAANASLTLRDVDGTIVTLTRGGNMTCSVVGAVATCTITSVLIPTVAGSTAGLQTPAQVDAAAGWTRTSDGATSNLVGKIVAGF
jgi:hypothetical protein